MSRHKTPRGCAVCSYFKNCVIRQYRENYPTETCANKDIIDAHILIRRIDKNRWKVPTKLFNDSLFIPIGDDLPLRLFRPMEINKSIINHAVMRINEKRL